MVVCDHCGYRFPLPRRHEALGRIVQIVKIMIGVIEVFLLQGGGSIALSARSAPQAECPNCGRRPFQAK